MHQNQKRLAKRLRNAVCGSMPSGHLNLIGQIKTNDEYYSDLKGIKLMKLQSLFKRIMDSVDPLWQDLRQGLLNTEILNISDCCIGEDDDFIQDLLNLLQYLPKCKVIMLRCTSLHYASIENILLLLEKLEYLDVCFTYLGSAWRHDVFTELYRRKLLQKFIFLCNEKDLLRNEWTHMVDDDKAEEIARQGHTNYFRDYFSRAREGNETKFKRIFKVLVDEPREDADDDYDDDYNDDYYHYHYDKSDVARVLRTYPDTPNYEMTECGFVE
jgi:hypothetical protein